MNAPKMYFIHSDFEEEGGKKEDRYFIIKYLTYLFYRSDKREYIVYRYYFRSLFSTHKFKIRCHHYFLLKCKFKDSTTVTVIQLKICTNKKGNGTITIKRAHQRKRLGVQNLHANEVRLFLCIPLSFGIRFNNYETVKTNFSDISLP